MRNITGQSGVSALNIFLFHDSDQIIPRIGKYYVAQGRRSHTHRQFAHLFAPAAPVCACSKPLATPAAS
jgi:hypothetical protein